MVEEFMDKIEEWNRSDRIEVDEYFLNSLEENIRYYETFVKMIESEVDFFDGNENEAVESIKNIKSYLKDLKEVLH